MFKNSNKEKKGIKGWLLFFIIIFTTLFPYLTIMNFIAPEIASPFSKYLPYDLIIIIEGTFSLLTGIFIILKKQNYINYLKIFMVFYFIHIIFNTIFLGGDSIIEKIGKLLYTSLILTFTYIYFNTSKRVKNTIVK
jgi:hypothetical protein